MIDTIRLSFELKKPQQLFNGDQFRPVPLEQIDSMRLGTYTYFNPSQFTKKYAPRYTVVRRADKSGQIVYSLLVEFSASKIIFGNNFNELDDSWLPHLVTAVRQSLDRDLALKYGDRDILKAEVSAVHFSKNIVYYDCTACQAVLSVLKQIDTSKHCADLKTDYKSGGWSFRQHSNTKDIIVYDKKAELKEARKSLKRAIDSTITDQDEQLDEMLSHKDADILRFEVRLIGKRAVKNALGGRHTLQAVFNAKVAKQYLLGEWNRLTENVKLLGIDSSKPYELLQSVISSNNKIRSTTALAITGALSIVNQDGAGINQLRALLDKNYGPHTWRRLKPMLVMPQSRQLDHFIHVGKTLDEFKPVLTEEVLSDLQNVSK